MKSKKGKNLLFNSSFDLEAVDIEFPMGWVWSNGEQLVGMGHNLKESKIHYVHYGYVKPVRKVYEKFKLYAELENKAIADERLADKILDDRPLYPFYREHPKVIREYVEKKAAEEAAKGDKLFCKPPLIIDWEVSSRENKDVCSD